MIPNMSAIGIPPQHTPHLDCKHATNMKKKKSNYIKIISTATITL